MTRAAVTHYRLLQFSVECLKHTNTEKQQTQYAYSVVWVSERQGSDHIFMNCLSIKTKQKLKAKGTMEILKVGWLRPKILFYVTLHYITCMLAFRNKRKFLFKVGTPRGRMGWGSYSDSLGYQRDSEPVPWFLFYCLLVSFFFVCFWNGSRWNTYGESQPRPHFPTHLYSI